MSKTLQKILFLFLISCSLSAVFAQTKITPTPISNLKINADNFLGYDSFGYYYQIKNNHYKSNGNVYVELNIGNMIKLDTDASDAEENNE